MARIDVRGPTSGPQAAGDETLARRFAPRRLRWQRWLWPWRAAAWAAGLWCVRSSKRMLDVFVASGVLLITAPVSMSLIAASLVARRPPVQRQAFLGRHARPRERYRFSLPTGRLGQLAARLGLDRLAVWVNVFAGDLSLVGPRPAAPGALALAGPQARQRLEVRPGLISLWWVRDRTRIAFDPEDHIEAEYVASQSTLGDVGLAARGLAAALYGGATATPAGQVRILGIPIANLSMEEAVNAILALLDGDRAATVFFTNPHCANLACADSEYRQVLCRADLNLVDGIGMRVAGRILGQDIAQNVNGTDLFPRLCVALAASGHGLFLLGGRPGVAEGVRDWLTSHHPGVRVCGWHHGYFTPAEEPQVLAHMAASGAHLVLVAFGVPHQEKWLSAHMVQTGARVGMGVGGLFDFYSGRLPRAPQWLRELGLEWTYRLYQEPGRMWRRYLVGNAAFLLRVLRQRWRSSDRPQAPEAI